MSDRTDKKYGPRILSLDADTAFLNAMRAILKSNGYEPLSSASSEQALAILGTQPIDLFTQDIHRPCMNGWELCRLMKSEKRLRQIPILIISGWPKPRSRKLLALIDGYFRKPFRVERLLSSVERALRERSRVTA
jgi:CheY-like chemotaxis protein